MVRLPILAALLLSLSACSAFEDYEVRVKDPTRPGRGLEEPFDAYSGRPEYYPGR